jgi:hypothetical protein
MGGLAPARIYVRPVPDYPDDKWRSTFRAHTRRDPPSREPGVDYYCPIGTVLVSIGDGYVSEVGGGIGPATGRYVKVNLDNGQSFRLLHLGPRHSLVPRGGRVRMGQPLAISGASGYGSEYFGASRPNDAQMILNTGGPHTHATLFPTHNYNNFAGLLDMEQWVMDSTTAGAGATPLPIEKEFDMPIFIRNTARGDYTVTPGVLAYSKSPDPLNVLRDPEADGGGEEINIIHIKDQDLDAVLFALTGITPEEIAVLPSGSVWVNQKLHSNPWINYGDSQHTLEIVVRSLDAKANAILERLDPERLAQIQADTAAAVDAALADNFEAIPGEVRDEFKDRPLS